MKKTLLVSFLILSLLASCATKSAVPADEVVPENVTATVVYDPSAMTTEQVPEPEVSESIPPIEQAIEESSVEEPPVVGITEVDGEEPLEDDSWMYAPIAEAPLEEKTVIEEPSAEEQPTATLVETEKPADVSQTPESAAEVKTDIPSTPAVQTAPESAVRQSSVATSPAASPSVVDKAVGFFQRIGQFIATQTLLSIGLLVDAIGIIYLLVVLVGSSSRRKDGRLDDVPEQKSDDEARKASAISHEEDKDVVLSDEDAFLKSLLGDDDK